MFRRLKEILTDALTYGSAQLLGQFVSFLLLPLYTSYLTKEDYGILAMLTILIAVFGPAFRLGLQGSVFRYVSRAKSDRARRRVISTAYVAAIASISFGLAVSLLFARPLTHALVGDAPVYLVSITLVSASLLAINDIPQSLLRLERRVKTVCLANLASLVASAGSTIYLVAGLEWGVFGYVIGTLMGVVVQTVLCVLTAPKFSVLRFRRRQLRILLSYGLPFVPHHLQAVGLAYLGQYVIRVFVSLEEAGMYNIALKFVLPFQLAVMCFQRAWKPIKFQIHRHDEKPQETFRQIFSVYCAMLAVGFTGIALLGPVLLRLMVQEPFREAGRLIPFVALIPLSRGLYFMLGTGIEFAKSPKKLPLVSLLGLIVLLAMSPLTWIWQGAGAAIATAVAWLAMGAAIYAYSQRLYSIKYDLALAMPVLVIPMMLGPLLVLSQIPTTHSLLVGVMVLSLLIGAVWKRMAAIDLHQVAAMRTNSR